MGPPTMITATTFSSELPISQNPKISKSDNRLPRSLNFVQSVKEENTATGGYRKVAWVVRAGQVGNFLDREKERRRKRENWSQNHSGWFTGDGFFLCLSFEF